MFENDECLKEFRENLTEQYRQLHDYTNRYNLDVLAFNNMVQQITDLRSVVPETITYKSIVGHLLPGTWEKNVYSLTYEYGDEDKNVIGRYNFRLDRFQPNQKTYQTEYNKEIKDDPVKLQARKAMLAKTYARRKEAKKAKAPKV